MNKDLLKKIIYVIISCIFVVMVMVVVYKIGESKGQSKELEQAVEVIPQTTTNTDKKSIQTDESKPSTEPAESKLEELTEPEFVLGTSQNQDAIYDMKAYALIKDTCFRTESMRDDEGNVYQIHLYSPNTKAQKSDFKGAFADEGEMTIKGQIFIALKKEDSNYFREYKATDEVVTLNLSRKLVHVEQNKFKDKLDFLLIGTVETSSDSYIRVYKISDDRMVQMEFIRDSAVEEGSYTSGTSFPFFNQSDVNTYETAFYDNAETFKFYIETFSVREDTNQFYGETVYGMNIDEFKEYAKTGTKPPQNTSSTVQQEQKSTSQYFGGNWIITNSYQTNGSVQMPLYMEGGKVSFDLNTNKVDVAINTNFMRCNFSSDILYVIDGERTINIFPTNPYGGEGFIYDTVSDSIVWIFGQNYVNNTTSIVILERND